MAEDKIGVPLNSKEMAQAVSKLLVVLSFTPSETTYEMNWLGAQDESSMSRKILPIEHQSPLLLFSENVENQVITQGRWRWWQN